MKRIIALFLSLMMIVSIAPMAFAAGGGTTVSFSLTSNGEHTVYVQTGDEITVDFSVLNQTNPGSSFTVETIYNDIKIDNNFFEIETATIESSILKNALFGTDSRGRKWGRFNSEYATAPGGLRTFTDGEIAGTIKLTVKATEGQTTLATTNPWMTDNGNVKFNIVAEDLTVIIGSEAPTLYMVKYVSEGEEVSTSQSAAGTITVASAPNNGPENHQFMGWINGGTLYQPGESFELSGDTTFTAKWERVVPNYTLTFDTNGGSDVEKQTKPEGTVIDLAQFTTTKTGFVFDGWYTDAEFKNKVTSVTLNSNTTVYAKWGEAPKPTYTLTFNTNGGTEVKSVTAQEGTVIDLKSYKTTKSGYTFEGWYSEKDFTTKVTSVTLDTNKTVYAKWKKEESGGGGGGGGGSAPEKYTITFTEVDGTKLDSLETKEGTTVDLSKYTFQKEGYVFEGWYTDKELTNKVTSVKITKDITLYAKWNKEEGTTPPAGDNHPEILTKDHYAYIVGREGGRIEPQANITRAEVATIFFRLLTEEVRKENLTRTNNFSDVADNSWYNTAVSTLASLGIINGRTEDTFAPSAYITRAEFTAIAARFSDAEYNGEDLFADISGHWAQDYINRAASLGWVQGNNGIFRPNDKITRAEVMTLVNRVLGRVPESEADLSENMTRWEDNANTSAWYYLAVQEATNSHDYELKADGIHEKWVSIKPNPDWTEFEK